MTINKKKLIELLVSKTGFEKAEIEEQLRELIDRIRSAAQKGKRFEIEGFGTFRVQDEVLQFEPSKTLETEINQQYTGMRPIELIGAFKEPADLDLEHPASGDFVKSEDAGADEKTESTPDITEEPTAPAEESFEETAEPADESEVEERDPFAESDEGEKPAEESAGEQQEGLRETVSETPVKKGSGNQSEQKDPIGTVLTVLVVIIAVGVLGWLAYDFVFSDPVQNAEYSRAAGTGAVQSASPSANSPKDTSPTGAASRPQKTPGNEPSAPVKNQAEQKAENTVPTTKETEKESGSSVYGLKGTKSTTGNKSYTIVVHSLRSQSKVERIQKRLDDDGYRTFISNTTVDGVTYWRLGLGQFKTVQDAMDAAQKLSEPYKSHHFIKRIH